MEILKTKKSIAIIVCVVALILILALSGSEKKELVGEWYLDGTNTWYFTFYSDGTCKVRNEYGTCKWDIIDGKFRITTFYGQTAETEKYSITGKKFTLNGNVFVKK